MKIINSVLIKYDISIDHLNIQFKDSVIWIIYSYTHSINQYEEESYLSRLPQEILQIVLLKSNYDEIKRLCAISTELMKVCKSDSFWISKIIHDYGFNPATKGLTKSLE